MAISIPDVAKVRVAYDYPPGLPGVAEVAITAPGPLVVTATATRNGLASMRPATGANNGAYIGFGLIPTPNVGDGVAALRATIIAGFAGVTPGALVYLDAADGTLTHAAGVSGANGAAVGKGYTAEMIYFF